MKRQIQKIILPFAALSLCFPASAQTAQEDTPVSSYLSLQHEMKLAITRGNDWLLKQQHEDGYWGKSDLPAFTALALTALVRAPEFDIHKPFSEPIQKGFDWLLKQQKEDGGFYNRGLAVYNTATTITALLATGREEYEPAIVRARKYLVGQQWDSEKAGKKGNRNDGGIGYGEEKDRADLSNMATAIEAIVLSKQVIADGKYGDQPDLNWDAAISYLSRTQNLPETNKEEWVSDDEADKGGFVYAPGESKAGEVELKDGRTALRSYGSMSYQGLLSLIYAQLDADDPRVVAVKEWLGKNYTVEENPGMGAQGLYYYLQAMSKALSAAGIDKLKIGDGKFADWRNDAGQKLLSVQRENGSWVNENGRFMESDPLLVTCYTVLALEQINASIPE